MKREIAWPERRADVALKAGVINLNAGTCSPTLRPVLEEVLRMTTEQAEDPVEFIFRWAPTRLEAERRALAAFVGADAQDLLLVNNTTFAVNAVAKSLGLTAGDDVLMSDQEYTHYLPLWDQVAKDTGCRVKTVTLPLASDEATPAKIFSAFAAAWTPQTRVLYVSHVTSPCGMALPVRELCSLAREKGALSIIDGAHAVGLLPLDLKAMAPDFYTSNVHKWLMGAAGSAFLYVAPKARAHLKPLVTTATSVFPAAKADEPVWPGAPSHWAWSHEYQGTRNLIPHLVMSKAIAHHQSLGFAAIKSRTNALTKRARDEVARLGLEPASPAHPEIATSMVAWHWPKTKKPPNLAMASYRWRHEHGFEVAVPWLNDGRPLVRISCAWFTTDDELDRFFAALKAMDWNHLGA